MHTKLQLQAVGTQVNENRAVRQWYQIAGPQLPPHLCNHKRPVVSSLEERLAFQQAFLTIIYLGRLSHGLLGVRFLQIFQLLEAALSHHSEDNTQVPKLILISGK